MKNLTLIMTITVTTIVMSACSSKAMENPSQNSALNNISSSHKEKSGPMQESLDNWLKKEWTPTVEKSEDVKEKNLDKSRDFTIQEYVDKATLYIDDNNKTYKNSHTKKISSMPVIGK